VDALVQVLDAIFEVLLVLLPCHTVYARRRLALEPQEACLEKFRGDVVQ
jgi:hypothetical protein